MTMGSISFQSNISLILLMIIGILAGIYFYLDIRKIKLQIDDLEKSNGEIIKEIGNIGMGLHGILKGNIQGKELQREEQEEESKEELVEEQQNIDKEIDENISEINDELIQSSINNETTIDEDNEINADLLKNDLDDEVYDDDDSINTDDENIDMDELDENDGIDINELDENIDDNIENFDEDQQDINNIDDLLDINITDDSTQQYLNMSVKELKEKCIELGLKHSGNKQTLAQRIHEKLS